MKKNNNSIGKQTAIQDQNNLKLNKELNLKYTNLKNNFKTLSIEKNNNKDLEEIFEKYDKFYNSIISEKKKKRDTLFNIINYLENIISLNILNDSELQHAKTEKIRLLESINKIASDIENFLLP
jgi:hypothetical protein